jgi:hypothetical protein
VPLLELNSLLALLIIFNRFPILEITTELHWFQGLTLLQLTVLLAFPHFSTVIESQLIIRPVHLWLVLALLRPHKVGSQGQ